MPVSMFCAGRSAVSSDPKQHANHRFPFYMGIELELEDVRGPKAGEKSSAPLIHWTTHVDESLRNGTEYVTDQPLSGGDLVTAVDSFYHQNYRYTGGPRTSTHIHVNAANITIGNVQTMFAISYLMEDALFRVIEAKRKWCGYCMPLTEMGPVRIRRLMAAKRDHEVVEFMAGHNADKYYGFNVNSIRRHGTVEFRYFPGAPTKIELLDWMDYCTAIKKIGQKYTLANLAEFQDSVQLVKFLEDEMGSWGRRITRVVEAQSLFDLLQEVLAMASEDEGPNRRDELVFITKPLLKYINYRYCTTGPQRSWLLPRLQKLQVSTLDEFSSLLEESRLHSKESKDAVKKAAAEEWIELPAWARPAGGEVQPPPVVEEAQPQVVGRPNPLDDAAVREYIARMREVEARRPVVNPFRPAGQRLPRG